MSSLDAKESRQAHDEVYERPRVVDLGTFAELTLGRTVPGATDNVGRNGTQ